MRRKYIVTHGIKIAKDFVPETFGRLTTMGPAFKMHTTGDTSRAWVVCLCSCGETCVKQYKSIASGHTKSCGCYMVEVVTALHTTHGLRAKGMPRSSELDAYYSMIDRCCNPNNPDYEFYGGRGIGVWDTWRGPVGFELWFAEIGPKPTKGHSQDRFPNRDGNYEPGNIRWATWDEQCNNRRDNKFIEFDGKTQTLTHWARELGVSVSMLSQRLIAGWSVEKTLTTPPGPARNTKKHKKSPDPKI